MLFLNLRKPPDNFINPSWTVMLKYDSFIPIIKYETTPEAPKLLLKKSTFCAPHIKKSILSIKERKMKFNKLSNDLNIKLINGWELYISLIKKNIDNGKNLKIKTVGYSIQNKQIAFCSKLPFGILSFNRYLDIR